MIKAPIKFYYRVFPQINSKGKETGEVARPVVQILINYRHGKMFGPVEALLDSGSDFNLFPADIAHALGINLKSGIVKITEGIGRHRITTYRHSGIKIYIEGHSFDTSIDFSSDVTVPLLGQQGFFDKFKSIKFERPQEEFLLEPK